MPYGNEYVIPYTDICGRILADTGSIVTLFNEKFANRKALNTSITEPPVILKDTSNGETILTDHCLLQLTVITVRAERVTIAVPANSTSNPSHDTPPSTRDLGKYKDRVVSHQGGIVLGWLLS
jgi:hypothetical protein